LTGRIGRTFPLGFIQRKHTTVAMLPNGESVAQAIGVRDQQISALTKQIGDLQARNVATDALVQELQAQVQALLRLKR
jgi:cell division protein FtsB